MSEDSDKTIQSRGVSLADSEATIRDDNGTRNRRLKAGDMLLGRYEVLSELGQGGMGVVYRCLDRTGGVEVAVKALPPELSHSPEEMEEVRENYGLVSKLVHQNIAACRTLDMDPSTGDTYLVMEFVDGVPLKQWIRRMRKDGQLTLDKALPILRQVADALDYAHAQKIMHRDIKPGNIMVKSDGTVKVLDFGLAAQIRSSLSHVSMAYASRSGTNLYKSPEQWRGQPQGAATDQYALAATAYEMLSGHVPFEDDDPDVLRRAVLGDEPVRIDGIPDYANKALLQGLAKETSGRYATCTDFVKALGGGKAKLGGNQSKPQVNGLKFVAVAAVVVVLAVAGIAYNRHVATMRAEAERKAAETARIEAERKAEEELAARKKRAEDERSLKARRLELEVELEKVAREINGMRLDRGQTFGKHLDDFAKRHEIGKRAGSEESGIAVENYEAAMKEGEWLLKNAPLRESAGKLVKNVPPARDDALKYGVKTHAAETFKTASTAETEGLKAYENGQFEDAQDKLALALEGYAAARKEAIEKQMAAVTAKVAEARRNRDWAVLETCADACRLFASDESEKLSKEASEGRKADALAVELATARKAVDEKKWEEAIAHADAALKIKADNAEALKIKENAEMAWTAERVETELAAARKASEEKKWEEAIGRADAALKIKADNAEALKLKAAAEKAMKVANELSEAWKALQAEKWAEAIAHAENVLKLEPNNEEAKRLKAEAEDKWPRISIKATVDGREVEATLAGTDKTTPLEARNLPKGKSFTAQLLYRRGDDDYAGDCKFVIDWRGMKEITVELKNVTFKGIVTLTGNVSLEMVKIKAGSFTMGSPASELGREDDETQHRVTLTRDYWLGKYEVTQGQWKAIMGDNPSSFKKGDNYPVENVNWYEAIEFCKKLTEIERSAGRLPEGYEYTLPTEAQWEYACRAGTTTALNNGRNITDEKYNCDNLNEVGWYYYHKNSSSTQPVGRKRANAWGLYDMHGNVWEWCRDWYVDYPSGSVTDPVEPSSGSYRVLRGGSWDSGARGCRSAYRSYYDPSLRSNGNGFRVALAPVQ